MNRHKILVVDDDLVIIKAFSMKLTAAGYQVVTALEASQAIAAARREKPDLILLDINFPIDIGSDWDGFKIIAWLQRLEEVKGRPVVVISGGEASKFKARALAAGAIAYFQKPVKTDELLTLIKLTLGGETETPEKIPDAPTGVSA